MSNEGKNQANGITLYHAEWCGHCRKFKPVWDQLKEKLKGSGIKVAEYEDGQNKQQVENAGITGFPTIRITKNGQTTDYQGPRDLDSILKALGYDDKKSINQSGGGEDSDYYLMKYMKYKSKYLQLVEQLIN